MKAGAFEGGSGLERKEGLTHTLLQFLHYSSPTAVAFEGWLQRERGRGPPQQHSEHTLCGKFAPFLVGAAEKIEATFHPSNNHSLQCLLEAGSCTITLRPRFRPSLTMLS